MTTQFWERLTIEAYLCASKCLAQIEVGSSKHKSYDEHHWFLITVDEVKAHFALSILMSRKNKKSKALSVKWLNMLRPLLLFSIQKETMPEPLESC
jgi:hypothetical protein